MEFTLDDQTLHEPARTMVTKTMDKARSWKQRADFVLEDVFRSLFEDIDTDKIQSEVAELKKSSPDFRPVRLARTLARRTALRCAAAGVVTGLPGGALAIGTLGADLAYLLYQQFRLILGIAAIYGHAPTGTERFTEALSCLAYSSGVGIGKQGLATALASMTVEGRVMRLGRFVPLVGAVSGGALNYASVHVVSRAAIRYYENRIDVALADEIWAEGDREHA